MFEWLKAVVSCSMGSLAFLILAGTVIVGTIAFVVTGKERIMSGTIIVSLLFYIFAKLYCGPSLRDVLVMKPMAQKISDYIVKHGIPKSLEDIPGLPYRLEGCERSEEYWKRNSIGMAVKTNMQNATKIYTQEKCTYKMLGRSYEVYLMINNNIEDNSYDSTSLKLFNPISKTGIDYLFDFDTTDSQWVLADRPGENFKNIIVYSSESSGICNPMRQ